MLKNFAAIFAALIVLTSCSAVEKVSPQEISSVFGKDFSAKGVLCFDGIECEAELKSSEGKMRLSVEKTENISDFYAETDGKTIKLGYGELSADFIYSELPEKMPLKLFYSAFAELSEPDKISLSFSEGEITAFGENFSAVLSSEDFSLIRMDFPKYGVKFFAEEFAFFEPE